MIGRGETMAEAFENTAYGMFSVMADLAQYSPTESHVIHAAGMDDVTLLQSFLSRLIVLFEADQLLPLEFEITEISMGRLTCWVSTRPIADDIQWLGPAVKAVTYYQMSVQTSGREWSAKAILDV